MDEKSVATSTLQVETDDLDYLKALAKTLLTAAEPAVCVQVGDGPPRVLSGPDAQNLGAGMEVVLRGLGVSCFESATIH